MVGQAARGDVDLVIARAAPGDIEAILEVQRRAFVVEAEIYGRNDLPPLTEKREDVEPWLETGVVLKAVSRGRRDDGVLVGSVRGKMREDGETCYIGRLSVEPEHMNRGIGTKLMHAIEAEFPHALRYELATGHRSERNLALYERLGYRRTREEPVSEEVTLVWMGKGGEVRPVT